MAISRALFSGVSGLKNHSTYMDVIANNIANVNTFGYKYSRITFEETFAFLLQGASRPPGSSGGINPMQIGVGTSISSIDVVHTQGALEASGQTTDLAIQGDGFFIMDDGSGNLSYTRSGAFQFSADGKLNNPTNGQTVQGIVADSMGNLAVGTAIGDINLPFGQKAPANATSRVSYTGNLNAGDKPTGTKLQTAAIYAKEVAGTTAAGSNSNIQNMLGYNATTAVTTVLEGVAANTTTVTVSDGVDYNSDGLVDADDAYSFTYVATNTASNFDFNSMQDLADGINAVFGTTSGLGTVDVTFQTDGSLQFTRADVSKALTITSTNSNLQRSLESANMVVTTDAADTTGSTNQFSHVARSDDLLTNLRNSAGVDLGLDDGSTITMAGRVGGNIITTNTTLAVDALTSVSTYVEQVRQAFDITTGSVVTDSDGKLTILGDGGTDNALTTVNITAVNAAAADVSNFNTIYDSTPNNYVELQEAGNVTASASATVFDSLGQRHVQTITFTKDAKIENRWTWEIGMAEPATPSGGSTGVITFKTDGSLASFVFEGAATSFSFEPKTGALNPVTTEIDVGTIGAFEGITQLGTDSSLVARDQDGYGLGELSAVSIDDKGRVEGQFTNGNNLLLAQLSVAQFNNPGGLLRLGDNTYRQSSNSGVPIVGNAGTSIQAKIVPGALEQSNVDLAQEFTNMIVAQRGFQASARIITVTDQILTEIVNLKT